MKAQVSHGIPRCVLFANSKQFKGDTTDEYIIIKHWYTGLYPNHGFGFGFLWAGMGLSTELKPANMRGKLDHGTEAKLEGGCIQAGQKGGLYRAKVGFKSGNMGD